ncbi:MAG: toll/interleukin-1 receptor domain-containing protein [Gammaproteobacteria bacterium]|jgi:hypothetical protein
MGFLPQFKNDVFISYRRVSNESTDRWVDSFCANLYAELCDRVGDVVIWRDTNALHAGDAWRPEIAEAVDSSGVFLAVINRTYFDSDECRKEMDRFLGTLKAAKGDGRKLMPIFKHPSRSPEEMPAELHEIGHHEFFVREAEKWRELDPKRDADEYWERMSRMVQDLTVALESLQGRQKRQALGKVFIARVAPELRQERERLRSDLQQRGLLVVPETEYLWNADDHVQRIQNDLSEALLCIHLVSRAESIEPLTPERDRLQLKLAHEEMQKRQRPAPLVWIQSAASTAQCNQPLIDYIEQTLANEGVEYLQGSLEELKTQMHDMLPQPAAEDSAGPREVALLVEEADLGDLVPLKVLLAEHLGIEPRPVKFSGSTPKSDERLQRALETCQQVLIFWSRESDDWVTDLLDLPALQGHLRDKRVCIYVSGERTDEKDTFVTTKAIVVRADLQGDLQDSEADLRHFFNLLPEVAS